MEKFIVFIIIFLITKKIVVKSLAQKLITTIKNK